jgi:hypothetical protein
VTISSTVYIDSPWADSVYVFFNATRKRSYTMR